MRKFFKYILPLALIGISIVAVMIMIAIAKGKQPERKDTANQAIRVDTIPAQVTSLNFSVFSQGSVKPRT